MNDFINAGDEVRDDWRDRLRRSLQHSIHANGHRSQVDYVTMTLEQDFVVIPREVLPAVKRDERDGNSYRTDGQSVVYTSLENARTWCLRDIAVWQFIEKEGSALDVRRDALAKEFAGDTTAGYAHCSMTARKAIDRVIELEKAA